jgi:Selenocysteine lyase
LAELIRNKPLVYLDNAASCQKPQAVIDSIVHLYSHDYANVHRGVHTLSVRSTDKFEGARTKVKDFINAASDKEIILSEALPKLLTWSRRLMAKPISKPVTRF